MKSKILCDVFHWSSTVEENIMSKNINSRNILNSQIVSPRSWAKIEYTIVKEKILH